MAPPTPPRATEHQHQTFDTIINLLAKAMDTAAAQNLGHLGPAPARKLGLAGLKMRSTASAAESDELLALRLAEKVAAQLMELNRREDGAHTQASGSRTLPNSEPFPTLAPDSFRNILDPDGKDMNRSLDSLALALTNDHEIIAAGTNISRIAWSDRKARHGHGPRDNDREAPPIKFFVTPNPRKLTTGVNLTDALTYHPPDTPPAEATILTPECDIDTANPFPFLRENLP
jgi:hypothetical protein